jgi:hypothetical protein
MRAPRASGILPVSVNRKSSQYWPNYLNHLIGGGMSYRRMRELRLGVAPEKGMIPRARMVLAEPAELLARGIMPSSGAHVFNWARRRDRSQ